MLSLSVIKARSPLLLIAALAVSSSAFATNDSIVLKCTFVEKPDRPEGVSVFKDGKWNSPAGGVMPIQKGKWIQNGTSGVVLQDESGKRFAEVLGVIFKTVSAGSPGHRINVDGSGDAGSCDVTAVTP